MLPGVTAQTSLPSVDVMAGDSRSVNHQLTHLLFRDELLEFERNGVLTKLIVSFSRDRIPDGVNHSPKYVQDNIRIWGKELCSLIYNSRAFIFVCG